MMRQESMEYLDEFNRQFGVDADIVSLSYLLDVSDGRTYHFYKSEDSADPIKGTVPARLVGQLNQGEYFSVIDPKALGYSAVTSSNITDIYPMGNGTVSIGSPHIGYNGTRFSYDAADTTTLFPRCWTDNIDKIKATHPDKATVLSVILNGEINLLANTQQKKNYKSAWVYHQFMKKRDFLLEVVNGRILKDTPWFYHYRIHYNTFRSQIVKPSQKDLKEFRAAEFERSLNWD